MDADLKQLVDEVKAAGTRGLRLLESPAAAAGAACRRPPRLANAVERLEKVRLDNNFTYHKPLEDQLPR